jgi:hypothetical protein
MGDWLRRDIEEFDVELERLSEKMKWTVIYVPFSVEDKYGTRGRVPVQACIDGHLFASTLLPSEKGHYMVYNRRIQEACKKGLGDSVHVAIRLDSQERTVEMPGYLLNALADRPDLAERFEGQPDYIKREQLQHIEAAKREETRERRIAKLIELLEGTGQRYETS